MTYAEAEAFLYALPRFAIRGGEAYRPGLERMTALLTAMDDPQRAYETVHVAGTNGKGSTASFIAATATAAGRRTGLHTSPHLFRLTERMRLDGRPAPDDWLARAVSRYRGDLEAIGPSFFEATVALSLLYFAEAGAEIAVVEVGMGGRLDATNVLSPRAAVITPIALDHTEFLGDTLGAIAREKGGIIKPGIPILTSAEAPEALEVLRRLAAETDAPFHYVPDQVRIVLSRETLDRLTVDIETPFRRYEGLHVGLPGKHQAMNAALALRTAEETLPEARKSDAPARTGLGEVRRLAGIRGRLEVLRRAPTIVADVGHNPEGLATGLRFAQPLAAEQGGSLHVLFGTMRDKDVGSMARLLAEAGAYVYPVACPGDRALPQGELAASIRGYGGHVREEGSFLEALAFFRTTASPRDVLLVTGSYLVVAQLPLEIVGMGA